MRNATSPVEVTGTVDTTGARKVGLDPEGIGMLMSILTNQYTDKHAAVLREYFCNGWDSHVDAGRTDQPVLVTLPSDLQPSLLIQDFGVGLAEDEMLEIFGTYGKSTKRQDSNTTGGFGIGSKSAWTMGQQFVVTGVKGGFKTVALFALDAHGVGECNIMHSAPTEEPDGVLISLAVPDVESMNEAAARFFETVDRGTALVNGVEPTPIFETATQINDRTWVRPDHDGGIYVVMGQVSYRVDSHVMRQVHKRLADTGASKMSEALSQWNETTSIYFKVPIDSVTVHPSRERLRDTQRTVDGLVSLVTGLNADMTDSVQTKVDAAPSAYVAAKVLQDALDDLGAFQVSRKGITYKGAPLAKNVAVDMRTYSLVSKNPYSYRSSAKVVRRVDGTDAHGARSLVRIDVTQAARTLTITGVKDGEEGKVTRFLKRYLEEFPFPEGTSAPEWVFLSEQPWGVHDWFAYGTENGARTMTLEEFKAELRTMRTVAPRTVNEPSYTVGWGVSASRDLDDRDLLSEILDMGKPLVIFFERSYVRNAFARSILDDLYTPVVLLATQSEDALRKRVEEAGGEIFEGDWKAAVKAEAAKRLAEVTEDEKAAMGASEWVQEHTNWRLVPATWVHEMQRALGEDWEKVTHPVLHDVLETFEVAQAVAEDISADRVREIRELAEYAEETVKPTPFEYEIPEESDLFPLIAPLSWYAYRDDAIRADAIAYINSKA